LYKSLHGAISDKLIRMLNMNLHPVGIKHRTI